jgi:hypothetical protein
MGNYSRGKQREVVPESITQIRLAFSELQVEMGCDGPGVLGLFPVFGQHR